MATKRRRTSGPEQDTSSVLLDTDFEFDAPCWYVDLPKLLSGDLQCDDDDDSWFEVYHPSHFVHRQSLGGRSGQQSDASKGDSRDEGRRKAAVAARDENAEAQANMSGCHSNQNSMRARLEDFRTSKSQKQSQSHLTQPTQASKAKATAKAAAPATAPARVAGQVRPSASNSRTRPKAPGTATAAAAMPSTVRVGPRSGAAKAAAAAAAAAPEAAPATTTAAIGAAAARRPRAVKQVDMRGLEPIGDIANCTAVVKTAKRAAAAPAQAGGGSNAQAVAAAAQRRSSGFAAKHAGAARAGGDGEEMCDLEALISKHNKSVMKGKATYEPSRHTLKDYKAWETKTGKRYHELSVDQRAEANTAIDDMKRQAAAAAASKQ